MDTRHRHSIFCFLLLALGSLVNASEPLDEPGWRQTRLDLEAMLENSENEDLSEELNNAVEGTLTLIHRIDLAPEGEPLQGDAFLQGFDRYGNIMARYVDGHQNRHGRYRFSTRALRLVRNPPAFIEQERLRELIVNIAQTIIENHEPSTVVALDNLYNFLFEQRRVGVDTAVQQPIDVEIEALELPGLVLEGYIDRHQLGSLNNFTPTSTFIFR